MRKDPTAQPAVNGIPINLGGYEYTVPPLTLAQIRRFAPQLKTFDINPKSLDESAIDLLVDISHAALSRNYPDMSRDEVLAGVDLVTLLPLYQAVMGVAERTASTSSAE